MASHVPLAPSRPREKRGGGAGAQRKVRRHQSYKRIKGCTPRAFMDGRCSSRGGEGGGRRANGASEREREGTHALSKCATLWAPLGTLALFSRGTNPPLLLSTVRSYQIFSFFFFFFSLASYAATTLSLSTGVSRVLVSDHRQVDNLFGVEGEQGTERALFLFRAFLRWMERLGDSDVGFIRDNF